MLIAGRRDELNSFAIASSSGVPGPLRRRKRWPAFRLREVATAARGCRSIQGNWVGCCASLQGPCAVHVVSLTERVNLALILILASREQ
jgi:hypothetical protein